MRFWLVSWFIYLSALIMGLGFPGLGRLDAGRIWWLGPTTSVLAFCALLTASVTLILMIDVVLIRKFSRIILTP